MKMNIEDVISEVYILLQAIALPSGGYTTVEKLEATKQMIEIAKIMKG